MAVLAAEGQVLDRILDAASRSAHGSLQRRVYGALRAAQMKPTGARGVPMRVRSDRRPNDRRQCRSSTT
jgi:hypothetical protein